MGGRAEFQFSDWWTKPSQRRLLTGKPEVEIVAVASAAAMQVRAALGVLAAGQLRLQGARVGWLRRMKSWD